jgi:hypothetical protein
LSDHEKLVKFEQKIKQEARAHTLLIASFDQRYKNYDSQQIVRDIFFPGATRKEARRKSAT